MFENNRSRYEVQSCLLARLRTGLTKALNTKDTKFHEGKSKNL